MPKYEVYAIKTVSGVVVVHADNPEAAWDTAVREIRPGNFFEDGDFVDYEVPESYEDDFSDRVTEVDE